MHHIPLSLSFNSVDSEIIANRAFADPSCSQACCSPAIVGYSNVVRGISAKGLRAGTDSQGLRDNVECARRLSIAANNAEAVAVVGPSANLRVDHFRIAGPW